MRKDPNDSVARRPDLSTLHRTKRPGRLHDNGVALQVRHEAVTARHLDAVLVVDGNAHRCALFFYLTSIVTMFQNLSKSYVAGVLNHVSSRGTAPKSEGIKLRR